MTAAPATAPGRGFDAPAIDAAVAFRTALDLLSRPGRTGRLAVPEAPAPLSPAAGALLLTLADPDTPVWLSPELAMPGVARWLVFHAGAPLASDRALASFAVGRWASLLPLPDWPAGTPDYPDRSTTLIVEVDALEGGPPLALSGPGIAGAATAAPLLPDGAAVDLAANHRRYPLGVDLFLTAGDRAMGLPRSTRIGG